MKSFLFLVSWSIVSATLFSVSTATATELPIKKVVVLKSWPDLFVERGGDLDNSEAVAKHLAEDTALFEGNRKILLQHYGVSSENITSVAIDPKTCSFEVTSQTSVKWNCDIVFIY